MTWCKHNNLALNTHKTKEVIVDLRKNRGHHLPCWIRESEGSFNSSAKTHYPHRSSLTFIDALLKASLPAVSEYGIAIAQLRTYHWTVFPCIKDLYQSSKEGPQYH